MDSEHSHADVVATVSGAVASLDHLYSGMLSEPVVDLATRLAATLPDPLTKTLLLTTGAESNEPDLLAGLDILDDALAFCL